jgi:hypothetical protein
MGLQHGVSRVPGHALLVIDAGGAMAALGRTVAIQQASTRRLAGRGRGPGVWMTAALVGFESPRDPSPLRTQMGIPRSDRLRIGESGQVGHGGVQLLGQGADHRPGRILLAALDPRQVGPMDPRQWRQLFDRDPAGSAKAAHREAELGVGRWRRHGKEASLRRFALNIAYSLGQCEYVSGGGGVRGGRSRRGRSAWVSR